MLKNCLRLHQESGKKYNNLIHLNCLLVVAFTEFPHNIILLTFDVCNNIYQ